MWGSAVRLLTCAFVIATHAQLQPNMMDTDPSVQMAVPSKKKAVTLTTVTTTTATTTTAEAEKRILKQKSKGTLRLDAQAYHSGAGIALPTVPKMKSVSVWAVFPSAQGYEHAFKYVFDARPTIPAYLSTGSGEESMTTGGFKLLVDGKEEPPTYASIPRDVWTTVTFESSQPFETAVHLFERYNHQEFISATVGAVCYKYSPKKKANDTEVCFDLGSSEQLAEIQTTTFKNLEDIGQKVQSFAPLPAALGLVKSRNMTISTYGGCDRCLSMQGAVEATTTLVTELYFPNYAQLHIGNLATAEKHTAAGINEMTRVLTHALASLAGVIPESVMVEQIGDLPPYRTSVRMRTLSSMAEFVNGKWRRALGSPALLSKLAGLGVHERYVDWITGPEVIDLGKMDHPSEAYVTLTRKERASKLGIVKGPSHPPPAKEDGRKDINGCDVDKYERWCPALETCTVDYAGSRTGTCPVCDMEGYTWCATLGMCLDPAEGKPCPAEEASKRRSPPARVGIDDPKGCLGRGGPGSEYCGIKGRCIQAWRGGAGYPCPTIEGEEAADVPPLSDFKSSQTFEHNVKAVFSIPVTVRRYNVTGELSFPVGVLNAATWHVGFEDEVRAALVKVIGIKTEELQVGALNAVGRDSRISFMFTTVQGYGVTVDLIDALVQSVTSGSYLKALKKLTKEKLPAMPKGVSLSVQPSAFACVKPTMMTLGDKKMFMETVASLAMFDSKKMAITEVYIDTPSPCLGECQITLYPTLLLRFEDPDLAFAAGKTLSKNLQLGLSTTNKPFKGKQFEEMDGLTTFELVSTVPEPARESVTVYNKKKWQLGITLFGTLRFEQVDPIDFTVARKDAVAVLLGEAAGAQTVVREVQRVGDPGAGYVDVDFEMLVPDEKSRDLVDKLQTTDSVDQFAAKLALDTRWRPLKAVVGLGPEHIEILEVPYVVGQAKPSAQTGISELLQTETSGSGKKQVPTPTPYVLPKDLKDYLVKIVAVEITGVPDGVQYMQAKALNIAMATALGRNPADSYVTMEKLNNDAVLKAAERLNLDLDPSRTEAGPLSTAGADSAIVSAVFLKLAEPEVNRDVVAANMKETYRRVLADPAFMLWNGQLKVLAVEERKVRWTPDMLMLWQPTVPTPYPLPGAGSDADEDPIYDAEDNMEASGHSVTVPSPSPGPIISVLNGGLLMLGLECDIATTFKPHALVFKRVLQTNIQSATLKRFGKKLNEIPNQALVTPPVLILSETSANSKTELTVALPLISRSYLDANHLANLMQQQLTGLASGLPGFAYKVRMIKAPRFDYFNDTSYLARITSRVSFNMEPGSRMNLAGTEMKDGLASMGSNIKTVVSTLLKVPETWVVVKTTNGTTTLELSVPLEVDDNLPRTITRMLVSSASEISRKVFKRTTLLGSGSLVFSNPTTKIGIEPRVKVAGSQHILFNGTEANPYYVNLTIPESEGSGLMRGRQLPLDPRAQQRFYDIQLKITRPVQVEVVPQRNPNMLTSLY